jgi:Zn-finger nucleic acid-binding protein
MTSVRRAGIEIDVCPQCRGVWLDRGELEKLLQPLRDEATQHPARAWGRSIPASGHDDRSGRHHDDHAGKHGSHDQKRKSPWQNLMDVFD